MPPPPEKGEDVFDHTLPGGKSQHQKRVVPLLPLANRGRPQHCLLGSLGVPNMLRPLPAEGRQPNWFAQSRCPG